MGVSASVGLIHLWMARRWSDANVWVAAWSLLACVFLCARGVHLTTDDPLAAEYAGKTSYAVGPFLVWAIVGFGRVLNGRPVRGASLWLGAIAVGWALVIVPTHWFVVPVTTTMEDVFGRTHLSVEARWPTSVLALYIAAVLVHGVRRLAGSSHLDATERRVLIGGFATYGAMGVAAVLTGVGVWSVPAMAEYGPFVVSICLSYLLVRRRHRLEVKLAELLEERSVERQLQQAQRMESVGQLAAGIAHEINNPMAFVRANLGALDEVAASLRKSLASGSTHEVENSLDELSAVVEESREGVERTIAIARDMREFAHSGDELRARVDLEEILESCTRVAAIVGRGDGQVALTAEPALWVEGAPESLRQAFLNLIVNGLQAAGPEGRVWIDAARDGSAIRVRIHDDGPGVPEAHRARLFEPFYSTRPGGEGTGLGLYMSQQILARHEGTIGVDDGPEGGALFVVDLPATTGAHPGGSLGR